MAIMIPADVGQFATAGEGCFYRFLEAAAKPDHKYVSWYTPVVAGQVPDFILFNEDVGLIVFEVKDWDINQIASAGPDQFLLIKGRRKVYVSNPLAQARRYQFAILDKITQNQLADIMQQGGGKYFFGGIDLQHFYQAFGGNRSGYRVAPEFTGWQIITRNRFVHDGTDTGSDNHLNQAFEPQ